MYKKLPFRVIIYLLEFHALDIPKNNISIDDIKDDLFGYFKLDKFRKIFNLYKTISLDVNLFLNIRDSIFYYPTFRNVDEMIRVIDIIDVPYDPNDTTINWTGKSLVSKFLIPPTKDNRSTSKYLRYKFENIAYLTIYLTSNETDITKIIIDISL